MTAPGHAASELREVSFRYPGQAPLFCDLRLAVAEGSFTALVGPNGTGKSTLLALMAGMLRPESGDVRLFGRPVAALPRRAVGREVAFLSQGERVPEGATVLETVLQGRYARQGWFPFDVPDDVEAARVALRAADALALEERPAAALSAGERQRVLLARALAQEPRLLLLDEPAAALDLRHQVALYRRIAGLRAERNLTVVLVSHDLNLPAESADRFIVLSGGGIAADGPPEAILRRGVLEPVFGTALLEVALPGRRAPLILPATGSVPGS